MNLVNEFADIFTDDLVSLNFFRGSGNPTARQLLEQVRSADRQIREGTATRVLDVDNYVPPL